MTTQSGGAALHDAELKNLIKSKFLIIKIIHLALVVGAGMFGAVVLTLSRKGMTMQPVNNPILIIAAAMCFGSIAASLVLRTVLPRGVTMPADPAAVLVQYQTISLVQWAMIEGGALFAAVTTLTTRNGWAFALFCISLAFLAFRRPSERELLSMFTGREGTRNL